MNDTNQAPPLDTSTQTETLRRYLRKVTNELRLANQRVRDLENQRHEPVAITGIGCRLPGSVNNADDLWGLLSNGQDVIGGFPTDRGWDLTSLFDPDPDLGTAGTTYAKEGGFIHTAADFDPEFFGISPREATAIDPQQRLVLETSWEAIERAGINPKSLRGTNTGVFMGLIAQEYASMTQHSRESVAGHLLTGNACSVASGRVSYVLGLEGPALSVDTACSSSLVATHLAVQSLRSRECELALAGGATIMATPGMFLEFSRQFGLARDGRCKSFADTADGVAWSEGVGVLVLERLSDARRLKRPILAVIRGSAINQDGASNGLSAPNGPSQERVIAAALSDAELSAQDIDAVEAHGTGTALGDPIEAQAILATYGQDRTSDPVWLGSLKSNIGHTQAAAGVAGLIKMVAALQHEVLPKTLHIGTPSSHVDWDSGAVALLTQSRPWPTSHRPRRAAVSAFGISGTNAHLILEEAPADTVRAQTSSPTIGAVDPVPWLVTAQTDAALRTQAARLANWVAADSTINPVDVAYSLIHTRALFDHRAMVVGNDRAQLVTGLRAVARGAAHTHAAQGVARTGKTVFLFPDQCPLNHRLVCELMDTAPAFAEKLCECDEALARLTGWSVCAVLRDTLSAPPTAHPTVAQPLLFAVMASLAELWRSRGLIPDAAMGQSCGELAAAHSGGALSLGDAANLVVARSHHASVRHTIFGPARIPGSQPVPGQSRPIDSFPEVVPRDCQTAFYSTVTGTLTNTDTLGTEYWSANLSQEPYLQQTIESLFRDGYRFFVECSPHPVLTPKIQEIAASHGPAAPEIVTTGSLQGEDAGLCRFLLSAGHLIVGGAGIDGALFLPHGQPMSLPTYAFQRQRYWLSDTTARPSTPS
ncbi:type I polyketide synthase [Mycolicibacterium setense]